MKMKTDKIATSKSSFGSKNDDNHQYANTMNLPKTEFPLRSKPNDVQKTISLASFIYQSQVNCHFFDFFRIFVFEKLFFFYFIYFI